MSRSLPEPLRTIILCGLLFLGGCADQPPPDVGPTVDLILVAGQSNAVGFDAIPAELPADEADGKVLFWWRCGDPLPDAHDSTSGGQWTSLQHQPRGNPLTTEKPYETRQYGNFAHSTGGFGPEMGLARTLWRKDQRQLAVVKVAFSGTSMSQDWSPGKACYQSLVEETKSAIAAAERRGMKLRILALVWVQGESDANAKDAPNYTAALSEMIATLRHDLKAPEMFGLVGINTSNSGGKNAFIPKVIAAQKALAAKDRRVVYVDTAAATTANEAHWNSAGTLDAGRWFSEALLKFEGSKK